MQPNTGTKRVKFEECKAGHRKDDVIMCVNGLQEDGALGGIRMPSESVNIRLSIS